MADHKSICPITGCPGVRVRSERPRHKYTAISSDGMADQRFTKMHCTQNCGDYFIEELNLGHGFQFVGYASSADFIELPTSSKDIPLVAPIVGEWTLTHSRGIVEPKL